MSVPSSFNNVLDDFAAGDYLRLKRSFTLPDEFQDDKEFVTKVWLTVKTNPKDADVDAIFQVVITTTDGANGVITSPVSPNWNSLVEFKIILTNTNTKLLNPDYKYYYDIKYLTSAGHPRIKEIGIIRTRQGVTVAES